MRPDHYNPEIIEPSLGLVGAVADDEMVTSQRLVAHEETCSRIVARGNGVAKDDMIEFVADADDALTQIVVEVHMDRLVPIARLKVRSSHVAIRKRAFDVDFVLVADERVGFGYFHARGGNQSHNNKE